MNNVSTVRYRCGYERRLPTMENVIWKISSIKNLSGVYSKFSQKASSLSCSQNTFLRVFSAFSENAGVFYQAMMQARRELTQAPGKQSHRPNPVVFFRMLMNQNTTRRNSQIWWRGKSFYLLVKKSSENNGNGQLLNVYSLKNR